MSSKITLGNKCEQGIRYERAIRVHLSIIDDEFYSTHFSLSSKAFEERIYLYAECSKNPDFRKQDDYYFLELFFSVGSYGAREFLVGLNFGQAKMDKETLDHRIRSYLKAELDNDFSALVQQYLKKEQLMENWLNEHLKQ